MAAPKPYLGISRNRLTDLINEVNGKGRVEGVDFTYGTARPATGPNNENTAITLTPVPGTHYVGPVDVYYNRLPISVLADLPAGSTRKAVLNQFPMWIRNNIAEINEALGLDLDPSEVVNAVYYTPQASYPLTINSTSLAWLPSTYNFAAGLTPDTLLEDVIQDELSGFNPVVVPLTDVIEEDEFDGFSPAISDLGDILPDAYNGFDPVDVELNDEIQDVLDGFDLTPGVLEELIDDDWLDGFDLTPGLISNLIEDLLEGFDPVVGVLDELVQDSLDGFEITSGILEEEISDVLDGFVRTPGSLPDQLDDTLDGFVRTPTALDLIVPDFLDGFTRQNTPLSEILTDVLLGFDQAPGDLESSITDILDGFVLTPTSLDFLETVLNGFSTETVPLAGFVLTVLDGFVLTPGELNELITDKVDGFDLTPGDLEDVITSPADGFDLTPGPLAELIDNWVDGFTIAPTPLAELLTEALSGFDQTPGPLEQILDDTLDGFTEPETPLQDLILQDALAGFDAEQTPLTIMINADALDGFTLTPGDLDTLVGSPLDGFDLSPGDLANLVDNFLDGFDLTPGDLATVIPASLDGFAPVVGVMDELLADELEGFDLTPGDLEDVITTVQDGFDLSPGELGQLIDHFLDGFDLTPGVLEPLILDSLDGFAPVPQELEANIADFVDGFTPQADDRLILDDLIQEVQDGFDPVVETRLDLAVVIEPVLADAISQNDPYTIDLNLIGGMDGFEGPDPVAFADLIPELLEGFTPEPEWRVSIPNELATDVLDGFVMEPEWRTALDVVINPILDEAIARNDDFTFSDNVQGPVDALIPPDAATFDEVVETVLGGFDPEPEWRTPIVVDEVLDAFIRHEPFTIPENLPLTRMDGLEVPEPITEIWEFIEDNLIGFLPEPEWRLDLSQTTSPVLEYAIERNNAFTIDQRVWGVVEGYLPPDIVPFQEIIPDVLAGFDGVPDTRVVIPDEVQDVLDGFTPVPDTRIALEDAVDVLLGGGINQNDAYTFAMSFDDLTLDGYDKPDPLTVAEFIEDTLDGFVLTEGNLDDIVETVIDGFTPAPREIEDSLFDFLDGFAPERPGLHEFIQGDVLAGFDFVAVDIQELIPDSLAGFDGTIGLQEVIDHQLDGFEWTLRYLTDEMSTVLTGFTPEPDDRFVMDDVISDVVDGFAQAPRLFPGYFDDALDGFDMAPEWRDDLAVVTQAVIPNAIAKSNDYTVGDNLNSVNLTGWEPQEAAGFDDIIESKLAGFNPAPEWRKALQDVVRPTLNGGINKLANWTVGDNATGAVEGWDVGGDVGLDEVIGVDVLSGFDNVPDTRIKLETRIAPVFDNAIAKSARYEINESVSGPLSGYLVPEDPVLGEMILDKLDGFVPQPEWRVVLTARIPAVIPNAIAKNNAYTIQDNVNGTTLEDVESAGGAQLSDMVLAVIPNAIAKNNPLTAAELVSGPLDGIYPSVPTLGEKITANALAGFVRTPGNIATLIKTVQTGFTPAPDTRQILGEVIVYDDFDGFDLTSGVLAEEIPDVLPGFSESSQQLTAVMSTVLDGFVREVGVLQEIIPDDLDGFDLTPGSLGAQIPNAALDGFDPQVTPLGELIFADDLDGFEWATRALTGEIADLVDGFDPEPEWRLALDEVVEANVLQGFTLTPGSLTTSIDTVHDGFDFTPGSLQTSLSTVVDGFSVADRALDDDLIQDALAGFTVADTPLGEIVPSQVDGFSRGTRPIGDVMGTVLAGFVRSPGDLGTTIYQNHLDGFVRTEGSLITSINTVQDGFDLTPHPLGTMIATVLAGFTREPDAYPHLDTKIAAVIPNAIAKNDAYTLAMGLSGPMGGFTPPTKVKLPYFVNTVLGGFNPEPEVVLSQIFTGPMEGFEMPDA